MVYFCQHFYLDRKKKTLDYSLWFLSKFVKTMTSPKLGKKDTMQKSFLKGAKWRLFQFRSIFQCSVYKKAAKYVPCKCTCMVKVGAHTSVWWNILIAFLHNRVAESHEILSVCSLQ